MSNRRHLLAGAALFGILAPTVVQAQVSDADTAGTGEIVVTAQKRSERLSETPLSITAASGEQLARVGVASTADLVKIVPGFTFQASNYGSPVLGIRGISFYDPSTSNSPTVSVYVDQVPLPFLVMTSGASLDLERVEVLKGPQGTLFGQNSTGGAINYIAAKPTGELGFGGSAEYARFNQFNLEGFISGPISDTLRVRVAARTEQGGAWQKSATRPGDELGDRNFTTARILLDWTPSDSVRFELNANGFIDKSDTMAAQFLRYDASSPGSSLDAPTRDLVIARGNLRAPDKSRIADWNAGDDYRNDTEFYQLSLRGDIDLSDAVTLTSITAYSDLDYDALVDGDGTTVGLAGYRTASTIESFSQELRIAGELSGGDLKWMLGGVYSHDDAKETLFPSSELSSNAGLPTGVWANFFLSPPVSTFLPVNNAVNNQKIETIAAFGSLDYDLTATWSVSGSIRYTDRKNDAEGYLADPGDGRIAAAFNLALGGNTPPGGGLVYRASDLAFLGTARKTLHEDNLSWRVNTSWKPRSNLHLYANVTKGYKAGAFSLLPVVLDTQYEPVKQESVLAYELGVKASTSDNLVRLAGAIFRYDYTDKQLAGYATVPPLGFLPALVSIPKSRVNGAELNVELRPIEGLVLNTSATYVDTKVKRGTVRDPNAFPIDVAGDAFPYTPKWQLMGDVEYRFPVSGNLGAFAGVNVNYRTSTVGAFGGDADYAVPSYTLVDLRAGIESADGHWTAQIWGRNVFNEFYVVNTSHAIDAVARTAGRPATYGVKISFRY